MLARFWRRFVRMLGVASDLGSGTFLALVGVAAVSRVLRLTPLVLQPLHAGFPWLVAAVAPVAVVAAVRLRWFLLVPAIVLLVTGYFALRPAISPQRPNAAIGAVTWTVASANVLSWNATPDAAADVLAGLDVDVISLVELSPPIVAALERKNVLQDYPYQVLVPKYGSAGAGVLSKFPLDQSMAVSGSRGLPEVTVNRPNSRLRVTLVHPAPPIRSDDAKVWTSDMRDLAKRTSEDNIPQLFVGDFNGTRWQPSFGAILRRFRDVHETLGKGLSRSWPVTRRRRLPPLVRLDHALVSSDIAPLAVRDVFVPGSDHLAFVAELAVPPS